MTALENDKADGCPIMFEGETYIHGSHIIPKNWTDENTFLFSGANMRRREDYHCS
jgi:hypothetical protein